MALRLCITVKEARGVSLPSFDSAFVVQGSLGGQARETIPSTRSRQTQSSLTWPVGGELTWELGREEWQHIRSSRPTLKLCILRSSLVADASDDPASGAVIGFVLFDVRTAAVMETTVQDRLLLAPAAEFFLPIHRLEAEGTRGAERGPPARRSRSLSPSREGQLCVSVSLLSVGPPPTHSALPLSRSPLPRRRVVPGSSGTGRRRGVQRQQLRLLGLAEDGLTGLAAAAAPRPLSLTHPPLTHYPIPESVAAGSVTPPDPPAAAVAESSGSFVPSHRISTMGHGTPGQIFILSISLQLPRLVGGGIAPLRGCGAGRESVHGSAPAWLSFKVFGTLVQSPKFVGLPAELGGTDDGPPTDPEPGTAPLCTHQFGLHAPSLPALAEFFASAAPVRVFLCTHGQALAVAQLPLAAMVNAFPPAARAAEKAEQQSSAPPFGGVELSGSFLLQPISSAPQSVAPSPLDASEPLLLPVTITLAPALPAAAASASGLEELRQQPDTLPHAPRPVLSDASAGVQGTGSAPSPVPPVGAPASLGRRDVHSPASGGSTSSSCGSVTCEYLGPGLGLSHSHGHSPRGGGSSGAVTARSGRRSTGGSSVVRALSPISAGERGGAQGSHSIATEAPAAAGTEATRRGLRREASQGVGGPVSQPPAQLPVSQTSPAAVIPAAPQIQPLPQAPPSLRPLGSSGVLFLTPLLLALESVDLRLPWEAGGEGPDGAQLAPSAPLGDVLIAAELRYDGRFVPSEHIEPAVARAAGYSLQLGGQSPGEEVALESQRGSGLRLAASASVVQQHACAPVQATLERLQSASAAPQRPRAAPSHDAAGGASATAGPHASEHHSAGSSALLSARQRRSTAATQRSTPAHVSHPAAPAGRAPKAGAGPLPRVVWCSIRAALGDAMLLHLPESFAPSSSAAASAGAATPRSPAPPAPPLSSDAGGAEAGGESPAASTPPLEKQPLPGSGCGIAVLPFGALTLTIAATCSPSSAHSDQSESAPVRFTATAEVQAAVLVLSAQRTEAMLDAATAASSAAPGSDDELGLRLVVPLALVRAGGEAGASRLLSDRHAVGTATLRVRFMREGDAEEGGSEVEEEDAEEWDVAPAAPPIPSLGGSGAMGGSGIVLHPSVSARPVSPPPANEPGPLPAVPTSTPQPDDASAAAGAPPSAAPSAPPPPPSPDAYSALSSVLVARERFALATWRVEQEGRWRADARAADASREQAAAAAAAERDGERARSVAAAVERVGEVEARLRQRLVAVAAVEGDSLQAARAAQAAAAEAKREAQDMLQRATAVAAEAIDGARRSMAASEEQAARLAAEVAAQAARAAAAESEAAAMRATTAPPAATPRLEVQPPSTERSALRVQLLGLSQEVSRLRRDAEAARASTSHRFAAERATSLAALRVALLAEEERGALEEDRAALREIRRQAAEMRDGGRLHRGSGSQPQASPKAPASAGSETRGGDSDQRGEPGEAAQDEAPQPRAPVALEPAPVHYSSLPPAGSAAPSAASSLAWLGPSSLAVPMMGGLLTAAHGASSSLLPMVRALPARPASSLSSAVELESELARLRQQRRALVGGAARPPAAPGAAAASQPMMSVAHPAVVETDRAISFLSLRLKSMRAVPGFGAGGGAGRWGTGSGGPLPQTLFAGS